MGFDQYHEPADELPAETRTFARLCASVTEEAEAQRADAAIRQAQVLAEKLRSLGVDPDQLI